MQMRLEKLDTDKLLSLRNSIDSQLQKRRAQIQDSLQKLEAVRPSSRRRHSPMLGRRVAPKYKGPNGETWAGRGATPRWLRELVGRSKKQREKYRV